MKFPIRCMSCGNTGTVTGDTLAKAASGRALRCNVCQSEDIDLDTQEPSSAKTAMDVFERQRVDREMRYTPPDPNCNVCHGHGIGSVPSEQDGWRTRPCPGCGGTVAGRDFTSSRKTAAGSWVRWGDYQGGYYHDPENFIEGGVSDDGMWSVRKYVQDPEEWGSATETVWEEEGMRGSPLAGRSEVEKAIAAHASRKTAGVMEWTETIAGSQWDWHKGGLSAAIELLGDGYRWVVFMRSPTPTDPYRDERLGSGTASSLSAAKDAAGAVLGDGGPAVIAPGLASRKQASVDWRPVGREMFGTGAYMATDPSTGFNYVAEEARDGDYNLSVFYIPAFADDGWSWSVESDLAVLESGDKVANEQEAKAAAEAALERVRATSGGNQMTLFSSRKTAGQGSEDWHRGFDDGMAADWSTNPATGWDVTMNGNADYGDGFNAASDVRREIDSRGGPSAVGGDWVAYDDPDAFLQDFLSSRKRASGGPSGVIPNGTRVHVDRDVYGMMFNFDGEVRGGNYMGNMPPQSYTVMPDTFDGPALDGTTTVNANDLHPLDNLTMGSRKQAGDEFFDKLDASREKNEKKARENLEEAFKLSLTGLDSIRTADSGTWTPRVDAVSNAVTSLQTAVEAVGGVARSRFGSLRKRAISHAQVRSLAAAWHGGQWSPLYALSSSGAIIDGCESEVRECLGQAQVSEPGDVPALKSLLDYVRENGPRGPQDGWSDLWDDSWQTLASKRANAKPRVGSKQAGQRAYCDQPHPGGDAEADRWCEMYHQNNGPAVCKVCGAAGTKEAKDGPRCVAHWDEGVDGSWASAKPSGPVHKYQSKANAFQAVLQDILSTNPGLDRRHVARVARKTVRMMGASSELVHDEDGFEFWQKGDKVVVEKDGREVDSIDLEAGEDWRDAVSTFFLSVQAMRKRAVVWTETTQHLTDENMNPVTRPQWVIENPDFVAYISPFQPNPGTGLQEGHTWRLHGTPEYRDRTKVTVQTGGGGEGTSLEEAKRQAEAAIAEKFGPWYLEG